MMWSPGNVYSEPKAAKWLRTVQRRERSARMHRSAHPVVPPEGRASLSFRRCRAVKLRAAAFRPAPGSRWRTRQPARSAWPRTGRPCCPHEPRPPAARAFRAPRLARRRARPCPAAACRVQMARMRRPPASAQGGHLASTGSRPRAAALEPRPSRADDHERLRAPLPRPCRLGVSPAQVSADASDYAFDQYVDENKVTKYGDEKTLHELASGVCRAFERHVEWIDMLKATTRGDIRYADGEVLKRRSSHSASCSCCSTLGRARLR
jgi:hypothetical protein